MLQYITDPESEKSIADQVKEVIAGGCRWIEVFMPNSTDEEVQNTVEEIRPLVEPVDAFLILTDRVELAKKLNVGGVHLTENGMSPGKARLLLGAGAVVGASASTMDEIRKLRNFDVDYIALTPFKARVSTKLSLGIDGIRELTEGMEKEMIAIARVAREGIILEDVPGLLEAGVNGVAVRKAIAEAPDIKAASEAFIKLMPAKE